MSESRRETRKPPPGRWPWIAAGVLVLVGCTLLVLHVRRFQRFERFVTSIGGELTIEHDVPEWVARWTGEDVPRAFGRITEVRVVERSAFDATVTDAAIARLVERLESSPELRRLKIATWNAGDGALAQIGRLDQLESLSLRLYDHGNVTAEGWKPLGRLRNLRHADFTACHSVGDHLDVLEPLKKLEILVLDATWVDDDDIEPLTRMPSLREVSLTNTYVTEVGIQRLAEAIPRLNVSDD